MYFIQKSLGLFFCLVATVTLAAHAENTIAKNDTFADGTHRLKAQKNTPLMASHLPLTLTQKLALSEELIAARQHQFYDTPVVLQDAEGKRIQFKEELDPAKNYTLISTGKTAVTVRNIWFFREDGTYQSDNDSDTDICTAENPCSMLDQKVIDNIHRRSEPAQIWVATGTYAIPLTEHQEYNFHKMIKFYEHQNVYGRTTDFLHTPKDNTRPLILGALSWSGYSALESNSNEVESIRVYTDDSFTNSIYGKFFNLYSVGQLVVKNCALHLKTGLGGRMSVVNIEATNSILLSNSEIKAEIRGSSSTSNLQAARITVIASTLNLENSGGENIRGYGELHISHSIIFHHSNCGSSSAIDRRGPAPISIYNTSITLESNITCRMLELPDLAAIEIQTFTPDSTYIDLVGVKIDVRSDSKDALVFALHGSKLNMHINESQFNISSSSPNAFVFATSGQIRLGTIPSVLTISGNKPDHFFRPTDFLSVFNESNPASQCIYNETVSQDCNYPA